MHIDSIQYNQINFIKSHIILIGTNGDNFGVKANVILPGCSFVERDSVYVNLEALYKQPVKLWDLWRRLVLIERYYRR